MSQEDTSVFPRRNPAASHCLRGASQAFAVRTPLLLGGVDTCTQGERDAHQQLELSLKYCFILYSRGSMSILQTKRTWLRDVCRHTGIRF